MLEFDVEGFVAKMDRMGLKLTAVPLADGRFRLNRWRTMQASEHTRSRTYGAPRSAPTRTASIWWLLISLRQPRRTRDDRLLRQTTVRTAGRVPRLAWRRSPNDISRAGPAGGIIRMARSG
jgi:hypothetical protein